MLASLNDYFQAKYQRYWSLLSHDTDDQRILQSDWMRGTCGYTQPKLVASDTAFPWWLTPSIKNKISLDFLRDIVVQRILQSDWTRDWPGHIQSKVVIADATFSWWSFSSKNLRYQLIPSRDTDDQRICNLIGQERYTWPHPNKSGSIRCYLPSMIISMQKI